MNSNQWSFELITFLMSFEFMAIQAVRFSKWNPHLYFKNHLFSWKLTFKNQSTSTASPTIYATASCHEKSSTFLWKPASNSRSAPLYPYSSVWPSLTLMLHHLRVLSINFAMFCLYFYLSPCLSLIEFELFSFARNLSICLLCQACLFLQKIRLHLRFLFRLWHLEIFTLFLHFRWAVWLIFSLRFDHFLRFQKEEQEVKF